MALRALLPLAQIAFVAGAVLLLAAAPGHLRGRARLAAALRRHGVLPRAWADRVARALGPAEGALAVAALALGWAGTAPAGGMRLASAAAVTAVAVLYLLFTVYLLLALRRAPGAPCACFGGDDPLTWATVVRAGVLGLIAAPAVLAAPPADAGVRATIAAAGIVLAGIAWAAPLLVRTPGPAHPSARTHTARRPRP